MPTKRQHVKRSIKTLSPGERAFLEDNPEGLDDFERGWVYFSLSMGMSPYPSADPKQLWEEYGDTFLPEFIQKNPGRRPVGWWLYDAPRQPHGGTKCYWEGKLVEPRRQLGGKGRTPWDAGLAIAPSFEYGVPISWVHFDESAPPLFESQAAYLERHGLLTEKETEIVKERSELMEPEVVTFRENAIYDRLAEKVKKENE